VEHAGTQRNTVEENGSKRAFESSCDVTRDTKTITDIYKRLCLKLKSNDPYAPFDALAVLIGRRNSAIFCRDRLGFHFRPSSTSTSTSNLDSNVMDLDN
jgi:hypothetical protein